VKLTIRQSDSGDRTDRSTSQPAGAKGSLDCVDARTHVQKLFHFFRGEDKHGASDFELVCAIATQLGSYGFPDRVGSEKLIALGAQLGVLGLD
jgi:hypothetical protein